MGNSPTDDLPYRGTLEGRHFNAIVEGSPNYLQYVCQWRGGTLTGSFNSDFTAFDADETIFGGPPEQQTTVRRRWVGRPIAN